VARAGAINKTAITAMNTREARKQLIETPILPAAMLFDMDGTLTVPYFDFPAIRAEIGVGSPILEAIEKLDDEKREAALAILHRHEDRCAAECVLNPGCEELIQWLKERSVKLAVVTRNTFKSASTVFGRLKIPIDMLITRDDEAPFKPAPDPLLLACRRLNVSPEQTWMIGDGQYDIEAGRAAGIRTIWLSHGNRRDFDATPDVVLRDLIDLNAWLKQLHPDRL
jgi:HAD superfamily hydrolase (TIGR01509 family)